ncbi:MAG: class B sortase [Eubacterium sp.]|nr:class B sortase [Eubacterium sp.]
MNRKTDLMSDKTKNSQQDEQRKKERRIIIVLLIILFVIVGSAFLGYYLYTQYDARQNDEYASRIAATTQSVDEHIAKNPIDFDSIRSSNQDIYAWVKVPGTKVDYPVVQHPSDDYFYLKHEAYNKTWSSSGSVYAELGNTKTFRDRVTVLYGHNGYGDTMFTTLHNFESTEFFNKRDKFYIYMPQRKLTYKIVSAFKYDDRHLLNCFDFNDTTVYRDFIKMIQAPDTNNKNVRENLGRVLTTNDHIVVLSTCFTNQRSNRYLVCGVLIKDEKTN